MSIHQICILPQGFEKKVIFSKIAEILSNFYISVPLYRVKSTFKCEFPGGARRCEDGIDIINSTLKMELNRLGLVLRTAESLSVFAFWKSAKLWETQQNSWNFHWQWHQRSVHVVYSNFYPIFYPNFRISKKSDTQIWSKFGSFGYF